MPGDLYVGGGIHMPIEATVDYWPVTGVTEPQHHWPFIQTGNYTDQGSTGGLDLTASGSPSFDSQGMVLTGSEYAYHSANNDLNDLGSTYSILMEIYPDDADGATGAVLGNVNAGLGWAIPYLPGIGAPVWNRVYNPESTVVDVNWLTAEFSGVSWVDGAKYQIVLVHTGGNSLAYINAVAASGNPKTQADPLTSTANFTVGSGIWSNFIGTIGRVGILKGTAWSADDVAAIYTAFS